MYPTDMRYSREHEWSKLDGDDIVVGITDYAQQELGDVVYTELPSLGTKVTAGAEFGTVESVKAVSALYAPVSGEIVAVNERLTSEPELINKEPHGAGWMVRVRAPDRKEFDALLSAEAYEKLVNELHA